MIIRKDQATAAPRQWQIALQSVLPKWQKGVQRSIPRERCYTLLQIARLWIGWTWWTCILSLVAIAVQWFIIFFKYRYYLKIHLAPSLTDSIHIKWFLMTLLRALEKLDEILNSKPIPCVQTDQTVPRTTGHMRCQCQWEWRQWGHCCILEPWRNLTSPNFARVAFQSFVKWGLGSWGLCGDSWNVSISSSQIFLSCLALSRLHAHVTLLTLFSFHFRLWFA